MGSKDISLPRPLAGDLRRPDAQGRIIIGKENVGKTFSVEVLANGDILLRPVIAVHEREAWLWANPEAMASLQRGMTQAMNGDLVDLGSFEVEDADVDAD